MTRSGRRGADTAAGEAKPEDVAEIIFTSGATAEPKGVVLTHRNILANIVPIERELTKYRRYVNLVRPIRFLNLLPLSHMFGQSLATFVPPLLQSEVFFMRSYAPQDIVERVRASRVSVLVCVPKILEVLRDHLRRVAPEVHEPSAPGTHWVRRWWIYRRIHRMFGLKFWAIVVGAAPLDTELEAFFTELGFVVIQGYGLTETAPVVTLNHPFHRSHGAVGKPIAGVEVKIAPDGEILVRGDNVTTGYFNAPEETRSAFRDGWFHTGDIGELDPEGHLRIRGRKKEMIVTPEGLNVFPDDVERVLNGVAGVRESAVVGAAPAGSSSERVQAILVLEPGTDPDAVVRTANVQLADHQKIRAAAVWPGAELPRTEGTRKLRRRELRQWVAANSTGSAAPAISSRGSRTVASVLERFAPGRRITSATTIGELGLSSLERVELMMAIEETFEVTVDEARFAAAATVGELESLIEPAGTGEAASKGSTTHSELATANTPIESGTRGGADRFPRWNRTALARGVRAASLPTWILPVARVFMAVDVHGPRTPAPSRSPGDLRCEPPESSRHGRDPDRAPPPLAQQRRPGDAQGVLQSAFLSRRLQPRDTAWQQCVLFGGSTLLQCVPAAAKRKRNQADPEVCWRVSRRRSVDPHLSGRQANGGRRDRRVSTRRRHDGGSAWASGRAGPDRWPRSHPPSFVEVSTPRTRVGAFRSRYLVDWQ